VAEGRKKNMARGGRLLALKEMGLGLGFFFCVFSNVSKLPPPPNFCVCYDLYL